MGRVIVIGTGRLAQSVVRAVRARGGDAVAVGRRDGVDVTQAVDLRPHAGDEGVAAVVEATGTSASNTREIARFFESSARNVAAAAAAVGAQAHVVVSSGGCERAAGYAYYAGKAAQEATARAAATSAVPAVVVGDPVVAESVARQYDDLPGDPFDLHAVADEESARAALADGSARAALVVDLDGSTDRLLLASSNDDLLDAAVLDRVEEVERRIDRLVAVDVVGPADADERQGAARLAVALALFVFIVGPTVFILNLVPTSIGSYFADLPMMAARTLLAGPSIAL